MVSKHFAFIGHCCLPACFGKRSRQQAHERDSDSINGIRFPNAGHQRTVEHQRQGSMRALPETWFHPPQRTGGQGEKP